MSKILVIVPHGDDEVLLCGGTIAKHIESGDRVTCVFAKRAHSSRTEMQLQDSFLAQKELGYQHIIHLDSTFNEISSVIRSLDYTLAEQCPDIIYTTFGNDIHQDHRLLHDAVISACRVWSPGSPRQILCGEILSSTDQVPQSKFSPNHYNVLSQSHIEKKQKALSIYHDELKKFPHPRSVEGVSILSKKRGMECGYEYAESFVCIRNVIP